MKRPSSPFPGLRPFEPGESSIFFGRGQHLGAMLTILRRDRFLAVVGSSGSGKSSLVKAGLLPAVAQGHLGERSWRFVIARPGGDPFTNLADELIRATEFPPIDSELPQPPERATIDPQLRQFRVATLRSGPRGLIDALLDSPLDDDTGIVVVVDQFEELFRFGDVSGKAAPDRMAEARQFVDMLLSSTHSARSAAQNACGASSTDWDAGRLPLYVVLTMRSDWLGECCTFPGLAEAVDQSQFLTPRLDRNQLRDAIVRPLTAWQTAIDDRIVMQLLNEAGTQQDQLPQLQHLLLRLWRLATSSEFAAAAPAAAKTAVDPGETGASPTRITWDEHYVETRGLSKCLDRHANDLFKRLTEPQQRIAEQLFRCLGERGPHGQLVRRVSSVREVCGVVRAGFDSLHANERQRQVDAVIEVVDKFRQPGVHFLVTTPPGTLTIDSQIDISHESLLRQWEKLQDWLADEQKNVDIYLQLVRAAEQKEKNERALLDEIELREKLRWRDKYQPTATWADRYAKGCFAAAMTYLDDSREAAARREADKQRAQREEAVRKERELTRSQRLNLAAVAIVVVLGGLLIWAYRAHDRANRTFEQLQRKSTEATVVVLMAGLSGESTLPTEVEYRTLELLADSSPKVRVAFMKQLLTSPDKAERLRRRFPYILHALVGLDVHERDRFARLLLDSGKTPEPADRSINIACAEFGRLLNVDTTPFRLMIASNYLSAMEKTTPNDEALSQLGEALGDLGERLSPEQAATGVARIVAAMEDKAIGNHRLAALGESLGRMGERLPPEQAFAGAARIVATLEDKATESFGLNDLSISLGRLVGRLTPEQADELATRIVAAMEANKAIDHDRARSLDDALGRLGARLAPEQAAALATRIVTNVANKSIGSELASTIRRSLECLSKRLSSEQAAALAARIVTAMENKAIAASALVTLRQTLGDLRAQLPPEQAAVLATRIVAMMADETVDVDRVAMLGDSLRQLGERLPPEQAVAGATRIVAMMEDTAIGNYQLEELGESLRTLCELLPPERAAPLAKRIVAAMEVELGPNRLMTLRKSLGRMGELVSEEQAAASVTRIVAVLEDKAINSDRLVALGGLLGSLCERLPPELTAVTATRIVAAMEDQAIDSDRLAALGLSLGSLGQRLPPEQAAAAATRIVAAMQDNAIDYDRLAALGELLGSFGLRLPPKQAAAAAARIAAAMGGKAIDDDQLVHLGRALVSLGDQLPSEQVALATQTVLDAKVNASAWPNRLRLEQLLDDLHARLSREHAADLAARIVADMLDKDVGSNRRARLGESLASLGKALPPEQTGPLATRIVTAMEDKTCYGDRLATLVNAIDSLDAQLPPELAAGLITRIVKAMEAQGIDSDRRNKLGQSLGGLSERLAVDQATLGVAGIFAATTTVSSGHDLERLANSLAHHVEIVTPKDAFSVLKSTVCIGQVRRTVLAGLETKAGQNFGGDIWKAVRWAESQGIDVASVTRYPLRTVVAK